MASIAAANEETHEAWNGVLYERFSEFRKMIVGSLGRHGDAALRHCPPAPGSRVLDIGCGFGDTSRQIAAIVGAEGSVLGVDVAERFIEAARAETAEAGVANVAFAATDVQVGELPDGFGYAFSRFGTMFFANPVAALGNVRRSLVDGGRLCMVVWRRKPDNDWLHRAELAVEEYLTEPEESDEPTCGPGPFSMADADTVSTQLQAAGFADVDLRRCDIDVCIGDDLDRAVDLVTALGPAGEIIRLAGEEAERIRPEIEARLRDELAPYVRPEGVVAGSSTWIVTASAGGGG